MISMNERTNHSHSKVLQTSFVIPFLLDSKYGDKVGRYKPGQIKILGYINEDAANNVMVFTENLQITFN